MSRKHLRVALVGNPNAGKTTLFNQLTGLNQKVGNFPGVTVDKKEGFCSLPEGYSATITDLPGTYSLYPKSPDERVVFDYLANPHTPEFPDLVVVVVDASNLKRNLLLYSQLADLEIPLVLALNMIDVAERHGHKIDCALLSRLLEVPVVALNSRSGQGLVGLKQAVIRHTGQLPKRFYRPAAQVPEVISALQQYLEVDNDYRAFQLAHQYEKLPHLSEHQRKTIASVLNKVAFHGLSLQAAETMERYSMISGIVETVTSASDPVKTTVSDLLDRVLTHRIWGYAIFLGILFLIFQAIFSWASYPMDLIDQGMGALNEGLKASLPAGPFTDLLTDGIIAGLGGILVFIPQIALLFAFISLLEETGYMARVMFIMDRIMRQFGLNGRSVVPLISGVACAVPAIMSARSIDNPRDRLITIMVTPLMSCSARIPVFTALIGLMVPAEATWGFFNLQGLILMGLYLAGFVAVLLAAIVMHKGWKKAERSYFILELPGYKWPKGKNIGLTIAEKVKAFVLEAGKIIIAISIVLWVMASYGPGDAMEQAATQVQSELSQGTLAPQEESNRLAALRLQASYAGHFGQFIEPAIRPLGFDWKIGISLLTSFAAREVFIGTMSTIYSLGDGEEAEASIQEKMRADRRSDGTPVYSLATCVSLLVFYLLSMQCMSTLAVVWRETRSWKYPLIQLGYMTGAAWVLSFICYQLLR